MHEDYESDYRKNPIGRRVHDAESFNLMMETREMVEQMEAHMESKFADMERNIRKHGEASEQRHDELTRRIEQMSMSTITAIADNKKMAQDIQKLVTSAFPGGDADSHRRAHEAWIRKTEKEEEFWMHLKKQVVGWGATAAIAWAALLLWGGFLKGPL